MLVVGLGALGIPAAWALAAAGVGRLTLVDPDRVELSNLHRQWLYPTAALGAPKAELAAARLRAAFPRTAVEARVEAVTATTLPALFGAADVVLDATDGVDTKFLLNDGAVAARRAFSHAGVLGLLGQALTVLPGRSACLRCLFPEPPAADDLPTCQSAGVLGAVAGVVAAVQAGEALAVLAGRTPALAGALLSYDARHERWRQVRVARNPRCPTCAALPAAALDAAAPAG